MDRLRSALTAPGGARLIGALVALLGVVLLVVGVVVLDGGNSGSSGAAPPPPALSSSPPSVSPTAGTSAPPRTTTAPRTTAPPGTTTAPPRTTVAPPPRTVAPRAPLTVLNNSTINRLADRAAAEAQGRGWQVAQVGNFAGRLAVTTVYFTPGDSAGQAAARELAREFPQIEQVLPRYAGLPPTPAGIVLVVTRDW